MWVILADSVEGTMVMILPGDQSQGEWPQEPQMGGAKKDTASSLELNHQTKAADRLDTSQISVSCRPGKTGE